MPVENTHVTPALHQVCDGSRTASRRRPGDGSERPLRRVACAARSAQRPRGAEPTR
jgi:hypothetical protein